MAKRAVLLSAELLAVHEPGPAGGEPTLRLRPGVAAAMGRLCRAGFRIVVAVGESHDDPLRARLRALLEENGLRVDGTCLALRVAAGTDGPPGDEALRKAVSGADVAPARSWAIASDPRDLAAAWGAGCRTVRVAVPPEGGAGGGTTAAAASAADFEAADLIGAARVILAESAVASPRPGRGTARLAGGICQLVAAAMILLVVLRLASLETWYSSMRYMLTIGWILVAFFFQAVAATLFVLGRRE